MLDHLMTLTSFKCPLLFRVPSSLRRSSSLILTTHITHDARQGSTVRQLKADGAPPEQIKAEVDKLKAMKVSDIILVLVSSWLHGLAT